MSASVSTIRRRGSSLDVLAGVSATTAPQKESVESPAASSGLNPLRVVLAVGLMALSAFGGATGYNRVAVPEVSRVNRRSLAETASIVAGGMEPFRRGLAQANYQACMDDVSKCPKYTMTGYKRLATDWKKRHTLNSKCYVERYMETPLDCHNTCTVLFETYLEGVEWGPYVTQSCKIGCSFYDKFYAEGHTQEPGVDCMWNCKNVVMNLDINVSKCNWNIGLAIAVFNAEEGFGAHHACEMGCLIGGARPCGLLQEMTGVA